MLLAWLNFLKFYSSESFVSWHKSHLYNKIFYFIFYNGKMISKYVEPFDNTKFSKIFAIFCTRVSPLYTKNSASPIWWRWRVLSRFPLPSTASLRDEQAEHFRNFMTGDNLLNGIRIISKSSSWTASFGPSSSTACSRDHAVPLDALHQIFIAVTSTSRSGNGSFVFPNREK